ncbi:MAG: type IX secretion system membrane protein PorP/SprF [Muribaculaceae bacterium]|nr:type IX secretion system membrane protein PorP/SprF [Muribaculaceae bacterium]
MTPRFLKYYLPLIVAALLGSLSVLRVNAQVDAQFSQYWAVPTYYNAGATGATDNIRIRGGARLQWVGIDNAPKTFVATGDMPFKLMNKRFGTGLVIQQESMGLYKNLNLDAQISYKLKLFKGVFSVGAEVGFINESFKGSEVFIPDDDDYHEGTDDAIPTQDLNGTSLDLGLGIYYTHKLFWLGISGRHLNSPVITFNAESGAGTNEKNYEFKAGRTLYFMGGCNIPIKNTLFEVIPSFMARTDFTFTTGEIDARLRYNKFLYAGVGYRYKDAVTAIIGAEFKNFYLGYSYDYPVSDIAKASSGSHEIFLGYALKLDLSEKNKNKHKSIRIM